MNKIRIRNIGKATKGRTYYVLSIPKEIVDLLKSMDITDKELLLKYSALERMFINSGLLDKKDSELAKRSLNEIEKILNMKKDFCYTFKNSGNEKEEYCHDYSNFIGYDFNEFFIRYIKYEQPCNLYQYNHQIIRSSISDFEAPIHSFGYPGPRYPGCE